MFYVEILVEKLVKNVLFRVFKTKKPLEKVSAKLFLDTLKIHQLSQSISKCLIFTEIRALKGEKKLFRLLLRLTFSLRIFDFKFWKGTSSTSSSKCRNCNLSWCNIEKLGVSRALKNRSLDLKIKPLNTLNKIIVFLSYLWISI